jgi:hypothetical protein
VEKKPHFRRTQGQTLVFGTAVATASRNSERDAVV